MLPIWDKTIDISFKINTVQYNQLPVEAMDHLLHGAAAHCTTVACV
jgi:hypothetical protein